MPVIVVVVNSGQPWGWSRYAVLPSRFTFCLFPCRIQVNRFEKGCVPALRFLTDAQPSYHLVVFGLRAGFQICHRYRQFFVCCFQALLRRDLLGHDRTEVAHEDFFDLREVPW